MSRGTGSPPEDGRWATAWSAVSFVQTVFTNGGDGTLNFSQYSPSPPESDWPLGQFSLDGSSSGAVLNTLTVTLSGSYSNLDGLQPFRVFAANTNDFSVASAIGSDAAASGGSVIFTGLADALPSGNRYYWVTVDLAAGASGSINGSVSGPSAFDLSGGSLSTSSVYGTLNTGFDVSLPVQLSAFNAETEEGKIVLQWTTQSEIANLGFIVRRGTDIEGPYTELASYAESEKLRGRGNTAEATTYQFSDDRVESGHTYYYTLIDVDFSGRQTTHGPIEVTASSPELTASKFHLDQNYPNPFNPRTIINYYIESTSEIDLSIYNTLGQEVATLVSGKQSAGSHSVEWDATSFTNSVYFYRITTDNGFSATRKLIVLK